MNFFIETLNQWGANFQDFAWPMLWQSSLLIAALLTFDFLFRRRLRATIRYALWLVVLVKLCVPPTLALPTSPVWWLHQTPPLVAAKPKLPHYTVTYDQGPLPEIPSTPLPVFESPKPTLTSAVWLLVIAGSGSGILLIWMLVRWWQITRLVRRAAISERLTTLTEGARCAIGMKKNVPVKLTSNTMSPAVCGLFRPVILIPQSLATEFSDEQLHAVLLHELIHLRRRDVWLNFLQALLQVVYWWHPLVWVANARIRRVREEAVDDTVMLALHDEAETYAPTLLEVAKLALNRPLATLGLVGILESRSALRQRIERLVDFRPPRKAGLTLVSVLGILAFTAVAVPMGEGPSPAEKPNTTDTAMVGEQSLTVKVNPEIFFRNLKAQAVKTMLSPTNDWGDILMGLLRDAGVDCNPPHGLAFTNATGDITTRNTREQLEVFRRVIEQLNRVDGKCELPLDNNPLRKNVLIEGRFYPMSAGEFDQFASGLHHYSGGLPSEEWWSVPPESFKPFIHGIEASGIKLIQRPRIQTGSGMPATLYVGNGTNSLEWSCKPMAKEGFIELAIECTFITGAPVNAVTNHIFSKASAEERGGIVLRMENYGGHAGSNLVVVISAETLTNTARFQERLVAVIHRAGSTNLTATNVTVGTVTGLLTDPNFRNVVHALEQRSGTEQLSDTTNVDTAGMMTRTFRVDQMIQAEELKKHLLEAGVKIPPTVFFYNDVSGTFGVRGSKEQLALVHQVVLKLNGYSTNEIEADNQNFMRSAGTLPSTGVTTKNLFSRTFRLNERVSTDVLQKNTGLQTTDVSLLARTFFSNLGVDFEHPPGKSVFYNERMSKLFVRATVADLDLIEQAVEVLVATPPQIHIKARFVEVPRSGKDMYLGMIATNGLNNSSIPSEVTFLTISPGNSNASTVSTRKPEVTGLTGILTEENFKVAMHALESLKDVEFLAEPEVITTGGRQTQMRATERISVVTDLAFQEVWTNGNGVVISNSIVPQAQQIETGLILDVVPDVLADGYTINLKVGPSVTEFLGYAKTNAEITITNLAGEKIKVAKPLPQFRVRQTTTSVNIRDNQTLVLSGFPEKHITAGNEVESKSNRSDKNLLVFITATIVDPAGNRVHPDDSRGRIPPQPK